MGFEAPETLYKLTWEDPAMTGLEVTVREPSIDDLLAMTGIEASDAKNMGPAEIRAGSRLAGAFAAVSRGLLKATLEARN